MAGRVNTKFVVVLVVSAVVVLGAGLGLFWKMVNKTGETFATKARQFEAQQDWESAEEAWGRAVGHEKTNVEWLRAWRESIGHIAPDTQTEYENFFARYIQISKQLAATLRTDPDEAASYLELRSVFFRYLGRPSRAQIEPYVNELNTMLVNFPESSVPEQRARLLRYRGLAWASLAGPSSPLTDEEIASAKDDLRAALGVDPKDGEAMRGLIELLDTERQHAQINKQTDRLAEIANEKREAVAALLAADPENPWGRISDLELSYEALAGAAPDARAAGKAELLARLDGFMGWLGDHVGEVDSRILDRAGVMEALLDPDAKNARLTGLYEKAIAAVGEKSDLLLKLAALRMQSGDYDGAVAMVQKVESQPRLPVSVEGRMRMFYKMQAPRQIAEFAVLQIDRTDDENESASLLQTAHEARDRYAEKVGTDNSSIEMLDGQIALAEAKLAERRNDPRASHDAYQAALEHFAKFNELTNYENRDGLWREGKTAMILDKTGLARQRFEKLHEMDPDSTDVLLALATVEEMLGTPANMSKALHLVNQALDKQPGNEKIIARRDRLRQLVGEARPDDPVEAIVFEAERLATGADGQAPDAIAAEKVVRDGLVQYPDDIRLVRQLVRVLVLSDRLDDAKAFVAEQHAKHPDDEVISKLSRRLSAGNMADIVILDIEDSNIPVLGKLLRKIEVYRRYGENEKAEEALAEAIKLAPDDPDVLEQRFLQALVRQQFDEAERIASKAEELNADKLDGITFRARLLAAQGDHSGAVELLREATSRMSTEAPLWRLLASEQAALGRSGDAIASYRRALEITENDPKTIRGYVGTLASSGRTEEALAEARRLRDYAKDDPSFLELYLQLEASVGGKEGRRIAIERRKQLLGERPFDVNNKLALAELYIDDRQWDEAKTLIEELQKDHDDSLRLVEVLAKWYADQGRVKTDDGYRDGIELARGAFIDYIVSHDAAKVGVDAYIAMARFMLDRGRDDVALRAVEEARQYQDPKRLRAEKLFGEIMMRRNLPRQASEAFAKVVEAGADDGADTYRKLLIEMLLRISDFDGAAREIAELDASHADDLTVLMQRADIAMYNDDADEAQKVVDRAMQLYPNSSMPFIKRAQILMMDENLWQDAKRNLEEALRVAPNDYQAHKLMATMYFREDRRDDAIKELRASLAINPNQDALLVATLIELIDAGREGEALDVANEVIDKRPTDATLMLIAGRVFTQREKWDRATVLFDRAWRLTKDSRVGIAYINALLATEPPKTNEATRVVLGLEQLGAKIDEDPVLLAARAMIEQRSGKAARAQSFLSRAYEQAVGNPGLVMQWFRDVRRVFEHADTGEAVRYIVSLRDGMPEGSEQRDWLTYGAALIRTQDNIETADAERDLEGLIADSKSDMIRRLSFRLLGSGRYSRKEFEKAEAAWKRGIEAFPDDWEMHNNLAYCVGVDLGRPAEAIPLARQATQLADNRADVYDTLGSLLLKTGELDEAQDALLKANERIKTERERVNVLLNLARLALAHGKVDEALRQWTEADTAVYTLPTLRGVVQDDLDEVKEQIRSARGQD